MIAMTDQTCRTCLNRIGDFNSLFACSTHLEFRTLGVPFDCGHHKTKFVAESTARPERSEDARNGSATNNQKSIFNQAKTSQKSPGFGFFFATAKKAVFFICRPVARQMSPVNKTGRV